MAETSHPRSRRRGDRLLPRLIERGVLALVVLSPLAIGGMHPVGSIASSLVLVALLVLSEVHLRGRGSARRFTPLAIALLGLAAFTLFRGLGMAAGLAPAFVSDAWAFWPDLEPRATLAPGALPLAALTLVGCAAALELGARHFIRRKAIENLGAAILLAAMLSFGTGVIQHLAGARSIFGLYAPLHGERLAMAWSGPFVNPNQAGALAGLGGIVALTWALRAREGRDRVLGLFLAALLAFWVLRVDAWGAAAALAASAAALPLLHALGGRLPTAGRRAAILVVCLGGVALTAALAWGIVPQASPGPLRGATIAKLGLWHDAFRHLPVAGAFGFGPESFADVHPSLDRTSGRIRHSYVESMPLGALLHHGWLVGGLWLAALTGAFGWALLRPNDGLPARRQLLLLGPLLYLGIESVTGMGLLSSALRIPALVALGAFVALPLVHPSVRDTGGGGEPRTRATRYGRSVLVAGTLLLTVATLPGLGRSLTDLRTRHVPLEVESLSIDEQHDRIRDAARERPASLEVLGAELRRAVAAEEATRVAAIYDHLERVAPSHRLTARADFAAAWFAEDEARLCRAARRRIAFADPRFRLEHPSGDPRRWVGCLTEDHEVEFAHARLGEADRLAWAMADLRMNPGRIASLRAAASSSAALAMGPVTDLYVDELLVRAPGDLANWHLALELAGTDAARIQRILDDGLQRFPQDPDLVLAWAQRAMRDPATAADAARRGRVAERLRELSTQPRLSPRQRRDERLLRAELAIQNGVPAEALTILLSLTHEERESPRALRLQARVELELGRSLEARRTLNRLFEVSPNDREGQRLLRALTGEP